MKTYLLASIFFFSACASNRVLETIPPFRPEKVCSDESLAYIQGSRKLPPPKKMLYSEDEIRNRMLTLEPLVRKCYEEEIVRTKKAHSFNLCLVVGYNAKAQMDYFEFSTKEISMSPELNKCLANLKSEKALQGFKELTINQPFRLYPKQK